MTRPEPPLRFEVKFVGPPVLRGELERWIRQQRAGFRRAYPPRQVNSVYLDDHRLSAFDENLTGASARTKVRFRWYGDDDGSPSGALELKCKRNMLGWKHTFPVEGLPMAGVAWREILLKLRQQVPDEARMVLDAHPQAVLINRYWRDYFVSQDGRVRVTVDAAQRVYDQRRDSMPNLTLPVNLPDALVLEVKGAAEDRDAIQRAVQGVPLRVSRHSKYVVGVRTILAA